jgi:hypothetical protein
VFNALTGPSNTKLGRLSGVCTHPDPDNAKNHIMTFMTSNDQTGNAAGVVWPILLRSHASFIEHPHVPWLLESREAISLITGAGIVVKANDLIGPPVLAQPDALLRSLGYEWTEDMAGLPLRGPHRDFDPNYVCGQTGGHLYIADGEVFTIGDFGLDWPPVGLPSRAAGGGATGLEIGK